MLTPSVRKKLAARLGGFDPIGRGPVLAGRFVAERVAVRVAAGAVPLLGQAVSVAFLAGDIYEVGRFLMRDEDKIR